MNEPLTTEKKKGTAGSHPCTPACLACNISRLHKIQDLLGGVVNEDILSELQKTIRNLESLLWAEGPAPKNTRLVFDLAQRVMDSL
jgi:hypothetical protein